MKNKQKKIVGDAVYQFGVNNSNTQEEWDWDRILDELEALDRLGELSFEVSEKAREEDWSLDKILCKIKELEKLKNDDVVENKDFDSELSSVWSFAIFGNLPIRNKDGGR